MNYFDVYSSLDFIDVIYLRGIIYVGELYTFRYLNVRIAWGVSTNQRLWLWNKAIPSPCFPKSRLFIKKSLFYYWLHLFLYVDVVHSILSFILLLYADYAIMMISITWSIILLPIFIINNKLSNKVKYKVNILDLL